MNGFRKLWVFLMVFLFAIQTVQVRAEEPQNTFSGEGFTLEFRETEGGLCLTGCSVSDGTLTVEIPETVSGLPVVEMRSGFDYTESFSTLVLPPTLESIRAYCLYDAQIDRIVLNGTEDLTIEPYALPRSGHSSIEIGPDLKTYRVENGLLIDHRTNTLLYAYYGIGEDCMIPYGTTEIGAGAFARRSLKTLMISETVRIISKNAFAECFSLQEVSFPEGLVMIQDYAFFSCDKIRSLAFPDSLLYIGSHAFYQDIGQDDHALSSITFGNGIRFIGENAFAHHHMEQVIIPDSIQFIEESAFDTDNDSFSITGWTIPAY